MNFKRLICILFDHTPKKALREFATFTYNGKECGTLIFCARCNQLYIHTTHPENYLMEPPK